MSFRDLSASFLRCVALAGLSLATATATIREEGSGILYGTDHAFGFTAPKGWMFDNESGVSQGVHMVFYPKGGSWSESKVVAYGVSRAKSDTLKTAEDSARKTIADFHANGSPGYTGKLAKTLKNSEGKDIALYHFSGDKYGNFEAVAYIVEEKTVNFVVMTCREEKLFQESLPAFEEIAKSYLFVSDRLEIEGKKTDDKKVEPKPPAEKKEPAPKSEGEK